MIKKTESVKKSKFYAKWDWAVYLALALIIGGIMLAVFLPEKNNELVSVEVYFGQQKIYDYDISAQKGTVTKTDGVTVEELEKSGKKYIKIKTEYGINVLEFFDGYVTMVEADCSILPDCVHKFHPIKSDGDVIICLPHRLKAVGVGKKGSNEVIL